MSMLSLAEAWLSLNVALVAALVVRAQGCRPARGAEVAASALYPRVCCEPDVLRLPSVSMTETMDKGPQHGKREGSP